MAAYELRLEFVALPKDPNEAKLVSQQMTMRFGSKGFEVVQALPLGANLLLVLKKAMP